MEKKKMSKRKKILLWLGGIIFIGGIIGQFSDSDTNSPAKPESTEKQQAEQADKGKKDSAKKEEPKEQKKEEPKKEEPKKEEPKDTANMEGYEDRIAELIKDSSGIILDIRPNVYTKNYQQMEIVVDGNVWEASSETDKIEFSEAIANAVGNALVGYGVLDMGKSVQYTILDQNDYELAKRGIMSSKFKIKR